MSQSEAQNARLVALVQRPAESTSYARDALLGVLDLHQCVGDDVGWWDCEGDDDRWPCSTVLALVEPYRQMMALDTLLTFCPRCETRIDYRRDVCDVCRRADERARAVDSGRCRFEDARGRCTTVTAGGNLCERHGF